MQVGAGVGLLYLLNMVAAACPSTALVPRASATGAPDFPTRP